MKRVMIRRRRRICRGCLQRRARFRYRGDVRADTDHELCFRCYRAVKNASPGSTADKVPSRNGVRDTQTSRINYERPVLLSE